MRSASAGETQSSPPAPSPHSPHPLARAAERVGAVGCALRDEPEAVAAKPVLRVALRAGDRVAADVVQAACAARRVDLEDEAALEAGLQRHRLQRPRRARVVGAALARSSVSCVCFAQSCSLGRKSWSWSLSRRPPAGRQTTWWPLCRSPALGRVRAYLQTRVLMSLSLCRRVDPSDVPGFRLSVL